MLLWSLGLTPQFRCPSVFKRHMLLRIYLSRHMKDCALMTGLLRCTWMFAYLWLCVWWLCLCQKPDKLSGCFLIRLHKLLINNVLGSISMHEILSWSQLKMACLYVSFNNYWILKNYWIWSSCLSPFHWAVQDTGLQSEHKFWLVFPSITNHCYYKK